MGRQVDFFATPTDMLGIETMLLEIEPYAVLHSRSPTSQPRVVKSFARIENERPWLFFFLVRLPELSSVKLKHVPQQGYWSIDVLKSPVVELSLGAFDATTLGRSRLYFTESFFDEKGKLIPKPDAFVLWGRSLITSTKRYLKRQTGSPFYAGEDALAWRANSHGVFIEM
jgi:hypothetical protein